MKLYFKRSFSAKRSFSIIALLTLAMCCGCERDSATAKDAPSSSGAASSPDKVGLESLLARTVLNDYSRRSFERLKNLGQKKMIADMAERGIKSSQVKKEVAGTPKTKRRKAKGASHPQPSLSRNEDPSPKTDTETKSLLAKDRL